MNMKTRLMIRNIGMTLLLPVGMLVVLAIVTKGVFGTPATLLSVLRTSIVPLLIGMAMSFNMAMGMWDFSTGAIVYCAAIFGANISYEHGWGIPGMLILAIVIAVLMSAVVGLLYNWMRIPCLVLSVGVCMVYEALPAVFAKGSSGRIGILDGYLAREPYNLIIFAISFVLFYLIYNKTVFGKNVQAIGANIAVANNAGVDIDKTKFLSYLVTGLFLGVSAASCISINVSLSAATGFQSSNIIFDSMMGVFIGTVLSKYCNYCVSVVIGVISIRMLGTGLVAAGLTSQVRTITTGIFLFVLLAYSANKGLFERIRSRKEVAASANREYSGSN